VTAVEGLRTVSLWQPRASLVACGVKTWETRGYRAKPGRIGIAATIRRPRAGDGMGPWAINFRASMFPGRAPIAYAYNPTENRSLELPLGVLLATAELVDCCPIGGPYSFRTGFAQGDEGDYPGQAVVVYHQGDPLGQPLWRPSLVVSEADTTTTDITDQLPFGIWDPGRWAWRLADIKPTTERCPWCWGKGYADPGVDVGGVMVKAFDQSYQQCPTCEGHGSCPPVPVKGKQGPWTWRPEAAA
jgi:hypothetical protein